MTFSSSESYSSTATRQAPLHHPHLFAPWHDCIIRTTSLTNPGHMAFGSPMVSGPQRMGVTKVDEIAIFGFTYG